MTGSTATMMRAVVRRTPDGFSPLQPQLDKRLKLSHAEALAVNARQVACKKELDIELPPMKETEGAPTGRYYLKRLPAGGDLREYVFVA